MAPKRKGRPIHGWLIVDKPAGMTSSAVVGRVRRATGAAKVGHGGTLDPMATGVLPIALGEATKTSGYVMDGAKVYRFGVRFGEARDTDDAEGSVTETSAVRPSDAEIEAALPVFIGDIEQVPPAYSAVKVAGRRSYALAREGRAPALAARRVRVARFEMLARPDPDHADFEVEAGKGTYVRALARDLARRVGTVGHIESLRRLRVGPFDEAAAISLEKLDALGHSAPLSEHLLAVETALADIPALALTEQEARRLKHGQPVPVLPVATRGPFDGVGQGDLVCAMAAGELVALARIAGGEIRPVRVLNLITEE